MFPPQLPKPTTAVASLFELYGIRGEISDSLWRIGPNAPIPKQLDFSAKVVAQKPVFAATMLSLTFHFSGVHSLIKEISIYSKDGSS